MMAGVAGALYVPQVGIINPASSRRPIRSRRSSGFARRRPRHAHRAALGAVLVNFGKTFFTGALPRILAVCAGRAVHPSRLFLPKGIVGLIDRLKRAAARRTEEPPLCRRRRPTERAA